MLACIIGHAQEKKDFLNGFISPINDVASRVWWH